MLNWKKFNNIEVFKVLRIKRGAVITVDRADGTLANLDLAELAAINSIASASSAGLAITGAISCTTGANLATSSGNVGIGTTSPAAKLDIGGAGSTTNAGTEFLKLAATSNSYGPHIGTSNRTYTHFSGSGNTSAFNLGLNGYQGSNPALGNWATVAPGLTAATVSFLAFELSTGFRFMSDSGKTTGDAAYTPTTHFTITPGGSVGIGKAPTSQLEISTDGATKPSTNTWTIASDERLKTDITLADLDRCYEIVKDLPLKRYTWKDSSYTLGDVKDRAKLGWIAQDVQQVFPKSTPTRKFDFVPEDDGFEEVKEQVTIDEARTTESTSIEIIDGIPTRKMTRTTKTVTVPQFDEVAVVDEMGRPVIVDGAPMMHAVPRMRTVSKAKTKTVTIDDCIYLNSDQIYAAMYGAIQLLIAKVEALEAR